MSIVPHVAMSLDINTRDSPRLQSFAAYSGKTYGEGSQHGVNVEFDLRRFVIVVQQLVHSKWGHGRTAPADL